jgi:arylsulfatase
MDPYERYDMTFNGAAATRTLSSSPGKYAGQDNGWVLSLLYPVLIDFDKSIMKYPNIKRFPGGASTDLVPNLQNPENPVPVLRGQNEPHTVGQGG